VAAGSVKGATLAAAQSLILRRVLPGFRSGAWDCATSVAADLVWLLGMLPSANRDVQAAPVQCRGTSHDDEEPDHTDHAVPRATSVRS